MEQTYEELSKKTVAQLREIAKELDDPALRGYTQLNKAHLLPAVCKALGIETHEHHEVVGLNKSQLKLKIKELKRDRDAVLEAHDHKQLKSIRRQIRTLKRELRKSTV